MLEGDLNLARARFFRALGDETRIAIIYALRKNRRMNVMEICNTLKKEQSNVSHHLACLRSCGIVQVKKNGKNVVYSLRSDEAAKILSIAEGHVRGALQSILTCEVVR